MVSPNLKFSDNATGKTDEQNQDQKNCQKSTEGDPGNIGPALEQFIRIPTGFDKLASKSSLILLRDIRHAIARDVGKTSDILYYPRIFLELLNSGRLVVCIDPGAFQVGHRAAIAVFGDDIQDMP